MLELNEPVWSDWIEPANLLSLVRNTAPFLFPEDVGPPVARLAPLASGPDGYLKILFAAQSHDWTPLSFEEKLEDYFALCIASHHATVATFVPTDVDSKIRGLIWRRARDPELVKRLAGIALTMHGWDVSGVTTRAVRDVELGPASGHDGEWFSVAAGAHGRLLQCGETEWADRVGEAIHLELEREIAMFERAVATPGREIDALLLAMIVTHNIGDLDQGISFWDTREFTKASRARFARLAHENTAAYGGRFKAPADLYRRSISAEGHRNYPLRAVKPLRKSRELLLPLGPFLDEWGATIATHAALDAMERAEVLDALVRGCRKIANQQGYFRAIAGFQGASQRNFDQACELIPAASRRDLREPGMRQQIAVPQGSFESRLRKLVTAMR